MAQQQAPTFQAKPITCLSTESHDDNVTDALTHYMGCIDVGDRSTYFNKRASKSERVKIQSEFRRIDHLRKALLHTSDKKDRALLEAVGKNLEKWRLDRREGIKRVRAWSKRGDVPWHDPESAWTGRTATDDPYHPDKDLKAYALAFEDGKGVAIENELCSGKFPDQKIVVYDLLHSDNSPLQKRTAESTASSGNVRYFHLPSNNMQWVEQAMKKYYDENDDTQYDTVHRKAPKRTQANTLLHRDFWRRQENGRDSTILHARHQRPFCEPVSSDPGFDKRNPDPSNIVLFMPYLHWDTDLQRKSFSTLFEHKLREQQRERLDYEKTRYKSRREARMGLYTEAELAAQSLHHGDRRSTMLDKFVGSVNDSWPGTLADVTSNVMRRMFGRAHANSRQLPRDEHDRLVIKNPLGQLLYNAAKLFEIMSSFRDRTLMDKYLLGDPHIHPRRTLDQAYYRALRNTTARDRDQVVYKKTSVRPDDVHHYDPPSAANTTGKWSCPRHPPEPSVGPRCQKPTEPAKKGSGVLTNTVRNLFSWEAKGPQNASCHSFPSSAETDVESGHANSMPEETQSHRGHTIQNNTCLDCREAIQKVPRLIMVDQLWMWILDDETIITCFPRRYGVNRKDDSGVYRSIRTRLASSTASKIMSAYDLALIIITECSNVFFDPTNTDERQPRLLDIFSEGIGDVAQKQKMYFDHLWHWADELATVATRKSSIVNVTHLHLALLNITKEGQLQRETKNIIEELGIMILLVKQQRTVIARFKKHAEGLLNPRGVFKKHHQRDNSESPGSQHHSFKNEESGFLRAYEAWDEFRLNADGTLHEIDQHLEELQALLHSADQVSHDVDQLLAMKQQQAGVVQAWQAIRQGEETVKQGRAIMIFTIITIIFLPLAFMAAIFGMNNDLTKNDNMSFTHQLKLIFGISVGVGALVIVLAFNSFLRCIFWCAAHYLITWLLVNTGLYGTWLSMSEVFKTEGMTKWCESKISKMKGDVRLKKRQELVKRYRMESGQDIQHAVG